MCLMFTSTSLEFTKTFALCDAALRTARGARVSLGLACLSSMSKTGDCCGNSNTWRIRLDRHSRQTSRRHTAHTRKNTALGCAGARRDRACRSPCSLFGSLRCVVSCGWRARLGAAPPPPARPARRGVCPCCHGGQRPCCHDRQRRRTRRQSAPRRSETRAAHATQQIHAHAHRVHSLGSLPSTKPMPCRGAHMHSQGSVG